MKIFEVVERIANRVTDYYYKNENDILKKSGIVFGIAAVISACVVTLESEKVIKKTREDLNNICETKNIEERPVQIEVIKTAGAGAVKVVGLMLIPAFFEYRSIKNFTTCADNYKMEALRWSGIAAAASAEVKEIMKRVKERWGDDAAKEIYYGTKTQEVEVTEDGKTIKKKLQVVDKPPVNHNIICFGPWTSPLYIDEEEYDCPGTNMKRIQGVFKTLNIYLSTSHKKFISMNMIAEELGVAESAEWHTEGRIYGEGILQYEVETVHELYEGRMIPIYYIEVNTLPNLQNRLDKVLPKAPIYDMLGS